MKPLVTLFIFTYNQEEYVREAAVAALSQDYNPLEIVISDDCSSDNTVSIIQEIVAQYSGPHTVTVNINKKNLGIGAHVNLAFNLAQGELLVLGAGDDISLPCRVSKVVDEWLSTDKRVSAIYSGATIINKEGNSCGPLSVGLSEIATTAYNLITYGRKGGPILLIGACAAYAMSMKEHFSPFLPGMNIEDIPLTIRASLLGGVSYIADELVLYRTGVSVWLPRKIQNEGFNRHRLRMIHRISANYAVAEQIYHDVNEIDADEKVKLAAYKRYLATQFVLESVRKERFLVSRYLQLCFSTGYVKPMLIPNFIVSYPWLHRVVYQIYSHVTALFGRSKR